METDYRLCKAAFGTVVMDQGHEKGGQGEQVEQLNLSARNDAIAGMLILLVVCIFASATGEIFEDPLDPGFSARDLPIAVLVLLTILSITLLRSALTELAKTGWRIYREGEVDCLMRYVVPMMVIASLYVVLMYMFQYPISTFVALSAALVMYGNRGYKRLLVIPFIAVSTYYLMFFGILGLFEEPGAAWSYSNQWYFRPLRDGLGLF